MSKQLTKEKEESKEKFEKRREEILKQEKKVYLNS